MYGPPPFGAVELRARASARWQNVLSEKEFAAQAKENLATNRGAGQGQVVNA